MNIENCEKLMFYTVGEMSETLDEMKRLEIESKDKNSNYTSDCYFSLVFDLNRTMSYINIINEEFQKELEKEREVRS